MVEICTTNNTRRINKNVCKPLNKYSKMILNK